MRTSLVLLLGLALAAAAAAQDLGPQAPVKTPRSYPESIPNPVRQGGDTFASAFTIPSLPFTDTGTTAGYANDYDEVCPTGSLAPDVVYRFESATPQSIEVDLCGSDYDTKVYIYDAHHAPHRL